MFTRTAGSRCSLTRGLLKNGDKDLTGENPMHYRGIRKKLAAAREKTNLREAVVTGKGKINGIETVIGVCDGRFLMASMGWAVGGKDYQSSGTGSN